MALLVNSVEFFVLFCFIEFKLFTVVNIKQKHYEF